MQARSILAILELPPHHHLRLKEEERQKLRLQFQAFKQNNLPNELIGTIKYVNWSYEKKWLKEN